ncbi:unnamed protein product [Fraxinus pennsylvanica]|uniref:Histone-binding protein RBBP4-like N-terminal domain-containing protein n=1 Tax=Fraxinus pennsylvanica TaxID=56036 RepID=A0AAD2EFP0_9LAMI|nr:unnamed protein product [Fraxinus pennsylvanica]
MRLSGHLSPSNGFHRPPSDNGPLAVHKLILGTHTSDEFPNFLMVAHVPRHAIEMEPDNSNIPKMLQWSSTYLSNIAGVIVFVVSLGMWATSFDRIRRKFFVDADASSEQYLFIQHSWSNSCCGFIGDVGNKFMVELGQSSSRRATGTPIKKLLAEEMSKETDVKRRSSSVIA